MGECPDWYSTVRAARYLNVAPWELLERPVYWTTWATMAEQAENEAERQQQERENRKKG